MVAERMSRGASEHSAIVRSTSGEDRPDDLLSSRAALGLILTVSLCVWVAFGFLLASIW